MRRFTNVAIVSLIAFGLSAVAYGQDRDRDWDHDRDRDSRQIYRGNYDQAYRAGVQQGQYDRNQRRRHDYKTEEWHHGDSSYRDAYRRGYDDGYNNAYRGGYGYPNNPPYAGNYPYPNNYPYGRGPRSYGNQAYQIGLQDGRMDGQNDRYTGHSYRPTHDDNYKHADRGYSSTYGDKNGYKQQYRSGYEVGYNQGYNQGGYRGR